jgi:ribonuclease BN (tRNA processing enzyme)
MGVTSMTRHWTRRALIRNGAALAGLGALARLAPVEGTTVLAQAGAGAPARAAAGSTLVLLGTQGGPNINLDRSQAANAVVVDGQPYLIDCGYGTLRSLVQAGLRYADVSHVFLTHLHDDHTSDVAALLSHQWTGSRTSATTVHGPFGTRALVDAAIAYFKGNTDIRMVDEGRTQGPESLFTGRDLAAPRISDVFRDGRVTVRAVENTHFPERAMKQMAYRSLSYRFDMADRSVVFSGDTAYSPTLVDLARNADLFVCETIEVALYQRLRQQAEQEEAKTGNRNSVARHIVETHSTTEDVGRMAAEAKVRTVVLSHLLPGANPGRGGELGDSAYIEGVRKHFTGEVIVGRDQMKL